MDVSATTAGNMFVRFGSSQVLAGTAPTSRQADLGTPLTHSGIPAIKPAVEARGWDVPV